MGSPPELEELEPDEPELESPVVVGGVLSGPQAIRTRDVAAAKKQWK
jgi:hypothetical protein